MMRPDRDMSSGLSEGPVYSPIARMFHWLTVVLVVIMVPVGLYMVWRGNATNFDATTNTLYTMHKTTGFCLLLLIVLRLIYRLVHRAPPDEPTLEWWQKGLSHLTHWGLYLLLLAVPMLGWLGVSYYDARGILGGYQLPALVGKDQAMAEKVLFWHGWVAIALVGLATMHIAAALYHYFIRRDGVLRRMLPGVGRND